MTTLVWDTSGRQTTGNQWHTNSQTAADLPGAAVFSDLHPLLYALAWSVHERCRHAGHAARHDMGYPLVVLFPRFHVQSALAWHNRSTFQDKPEPLLGLRGHEDLAVHCYL
eukprot:926395-Prorocentrum_minimum.AAC.7